MSAGARVAAFGALLVAIFALAAVAGRALDPARTADEPAHDAAAATQPGHHGAAAATGSGLRLVTGATTLAPRTARRFAFRVVDEHGATVRAFEPEQDRRMHLIVVRRDLRRFQHLHPVQDADGGWSTALTLPEAGVYHAFADFRSGGQRHTLGTDLFAPGRFEPLALPGLSTTARVDGYDVALHEPSAGTLRFAVRRGGEAVELERYLGARGHLVMLRAGDLAYEHVHPLSTTALQFATGESGPGRYRLFLQFRDRGTVHTAAFTHAVAR